METTNITVVGVWAFAIIWLVGMLVLRGDLFVSLFLFAIAIAVSGGMTAIKQDSIAAKKTTAS